MSGFCGVGSLVLRFAGRFRSGRRQWGQFYDRAGAAIAFLAITPSLFSGFSAFLIFRGGEWAIPARARSSVDTATRAGRIRPASEVLESLQEAMEEPMVPSKGVIRRSAERERLRPALQVRFLEPERVLRRPGSISEGLRWESEGFSCLVLDDRNFTGMGAGGGQIIFAA